MPLSLLNASNEFGTIIVADRGVDALGLERRGIKDAIDGRLAKGAVGHLDEFDENQALHGTLHTEKADLSLVEVSPTRV